VPQEAVLSSGVSCAPTNCFVGASQWHVLKARNCAKGVRSPDHVASKDSCPPLVSQFPNIRDQCEHSRPTCHDRLRQQQARMVTSTLNVNDLDACAMCMPETNLHLFVYVNSRGDRELTGGVRQHDLAHCL
jgi:hypothetical protein